MCATAVLTSRRRSGFSSGNGNHDGYYTVTGIGNRAAPHEFSTATLLRYVSEGAAKMAVYRLRGKFRNLLQAQVAETVATPDEIKEELRYLLSVLA